MAKRPMLGADLLVGRYFFPEKTAGNSGLGQVQIANVKESGRGISLKHSRPCDPHVDEQFRNNKGSEILRCTFP